ncbi:hypothetical protein L7F22_036883 [Adiantum nelumboides]|nr:hypothetical protein [Adiantum nelumboides]
MQTAKEQPGSGASSGASSTPNPQQGGSSSTANNSNNNSNNSAANSGGVGPAMGGSLAGVDLGPSMLAAAGPAATSGPSIPAGTGPGGTPTTALSVYHLITQLCQRPDPASIISANKQGAHFSGQGQGPATGATGAEALAGSSTQRETALLELSKKREQYEDLALVLWHSFGELLPLSPNRTPKVVLTAFSQPGVMSSLLQEIISVYPMLTPSSLSAHASNRVCNALALLQCVASHPETRVLFLNAHIPLFLYPFLNTTSKTRPFEYLRLTSLGVIGALVKQNDNSDIISFLLSTEIIPLCLRIMETGSELSKTVAIFIVQKILLDDTGLAYICQTYERFYAVGTVLSNMVTQIVESQAVRLLKHVVRCYLRLSDNPRAREALRACLPAPLRDATFSQLLKNDHITKRCLATLLLNLSDRVDS